MTLAPASVIAWEVGDMSRPIPSHDVVAVRQADAGQLGVSARDCYQAGLRGALCDQRTKDRLRRPGEAFDWAGLAAVSPGGSA